MARQTAEPKRMFSARLPQELIGIFRAYCQAKGATVDATMELALREYMERHEMDEDSKTIYAILIKRLAEADDGK